jgi:hypothetical protein
MNRVALPYVTTTSGISVFDTDNQYRPLLWHRAPNEIDWLNEEDNGLLLTLVEKFAPNAGRSLDQPVYWWTEDTRLDIHTTLTALVTATGTTLTVADPRIAIVNTFLFSPDDSEVMKVTAVDYTNSQLTVTRGYNGTARVAKAAGAKVIAMPAFMAELSDPNEGNGRLPGEKKWNCVSIVSSTFKVSKMQQNSNVLDNWGKAEKAVVDTMLDVRRQVGKALMFNARGTNAITNEGQEYISNGLMNYIQTGLLDLGTLNSNLTWPVLNDWLEARFDPDASSTTKELIAGLWLFKAIQRMVRDTKDETITPYFQPELGTMVYTISTDAGYTVNVMLDKYGLAVNEGLGDWGFLVDMAHIEGMHYNGFEFQWIPNIQATRSVMYREDAYLGSFSLIVKHESTHGVIRGAGSPIVTR